MTSKEAIEIARNVFQFENGEETDEWSRSVIEGLKQAEEDLEVLEIIKENHFAIDKNGNVYIGNKMDMMLGIEDYYKDEEESYNKIKECLENDN